MYTYDWLILLMIVNQWQMEVIASYHVMEMIDHILMRFILPMIIPFCFYNHRTGTREPEVLVG